MSETMKESRPMNLNLFRQVHCTLELPPPCTWLASPTPDEPRQVAGGMADGCAVLLTFVARPVHGDA